MSGLRRQLCLVLFWLLYNVMCPIKLNRICEHVIFCVMCGLAVDEGAWMSGNLVRHPVRSAQV